MTIAERLKRLWPREKVIKGCAARGDADSPYLSRWVLARWGGKMAREEETGEMRWQGWQLLLHRFHRSDADRELHDHPWAFVSLILWRGYIEETPRGRRRKWPGMLLFRPANWIHRVELLHGRPAWTLVLCAPRKRIWGFWLSGQWEQWTHYFKRMGC